MDTKRTVILMLLAVALIFAWQGSLWWLQKSHPEYFKDEQKQADVPASQPAAPASAPTSATAPAGGLAAIGAEAGAVRPARLGRFALEPNHKADDFRIGVEINPAGASLERVVLNRFRVKAKVDEPYVFQQPYPHGAPEARRALATVAAVINGTRVELGNTNWRLDNQTQTTATFAVDVTLPGAAAPFTITKTFEIRPPSHPGMGYEMAVTHSFVNRLPQGATVKLILNGTHVPRVESSRDVASLVNGFNAEGYVRVTNEAAGKAEYSENEGEKKQLDLRADAKGQPMLWSGTTSNYFDALILWSTDGKANPVTGAHAVALAKPDENTGEQFVQTFFETADIVVPAAAGPATLPSGSQPPATQPSLKPGVASLPLEVYVGPRWREVLDQPYYGSLPRGYEQTLVLRSGMCSFCTFDSIVTALVWLLEKFHVVFRDWGLAIICLVILVRLSLHWFTKQSQLSMHKMSKLAPEMQRLKEKFGDDKEAYNRAAWDLQKSQGFTPIWGCLPMFLQMPIWIALWACLQSTFELRQAPFLWGYTWIHDLAQPDHLLALREHFHIPLLSRLIGPVDGLNVLPLLLGVVFYLQQKMQPKPENMTPEQEQQHKMMKWMTFIFPLMLYNGPSGLNLYIMTSTGIGIWESKRVRAHIKAQEAAEKAGPRIVDPPETDPRGKKSRAGGKVLAGGSAQRETPQKRAGCLGGWLANMQKRVDEVMREAEKKRKS